MNAISRHGRRLRAFFFGQYGGPPIDYLLAIAAVYVAMIVIVARDLFRLSGS